MLRQNRIAAFDARTEMEPATSSALRTYDLLALSADGDAASRLETAFQSRRVEILDEMLNDRRDRVSVVALINEGAADVFVSGNQAAPRNPPLDEVEASLSDLLRRGRFEEGAALVLGRRHRHGGRHAGDYPELLRNLSLDKGDDQSARCAGGIAGMGEDARTLASTILWWEYARAIGRTPGLATLHALDRARAGFNSVHASWQASLASATRRRAARSMQLSLFEAPSSLAIEALRFEVVPAFVVSREVQTLDDWVVPGATSGLNWRFVGRVHLGLEALEPDYGETPLTLRSVRTGELSRGWVKVELAVDFRVRVALGLRTPSTRERLSYSMSDDGTAVQPRYVSAMAGETVVFRCDARALKAGVYLTCSSALGHFLQYDLAKGMGLRANGQSRESDATAAGAEAA